MSRLSITGANAAAVELDYEMFGNPEHPTVLLIMGLGLQRVAWPPALIDHLIAHGYSVLTFDNRDIGRSSSFDHLGVPNIPWTMAKAVLGLPIRSAYSLSDMARDSIGLLDALAIQKAHVVGISMGGMIAQLLAGLAPERVLTLTSIMSTTGRRGLPGPTPAARKALLAKPADPNDVEKLADHAVRTFRIIGTPNSTETDQALRERLIGSIRRSYRPKGVARQLHAIVADGSRVERLKALRLPALVIHGEADPLVPVQAGRDTAACIAGAQLVTIPGMGHDLAPEPLKVVAKSITDFYSSQAK